MIRDIVFELLEKITVHGQGQIRPLPFMCYLTRHVLNRYLIILQFILESFTNRTTLYIRQVMFFSVCIKYAGSCSLSEHVTAAEYVIEEPTEANKAVLSVKSQHALISLSTCQLEELL